MEKNICPKCQGKGYYIERNFIHYWLAIFTLGLSLAGDETDCLICDGKGYT